MHFVQEDFVLPVPDPGSRISPPWTAPQNIQKFSQPCSSPRLDLFTNEETPAGVGLCCQRRRFSAQMGVYVCCIQQLPGAASPVLPSGEHIVCTSSDTKSLFWGCTVHCRTVHHCLRLTRPLRPPLRNTQRGRYAF